MKFAEPSNAPETVEPNRQSGEETGLPGFRTWSSVYIFVTASFIIWVVVLVALYRLYS